ncbi:MAG TPA: hypothetical protein VM912_06410 [Terriglobales bacterium]|nr:hypothetical protein [Terriglobales bacterium]
MSPADELLDLVLVHRFYVAILEGNLGYRFPVPQEVIQGQSRSGDTKDALSTFLRWLGMLDLAVSPSMVRDQLHATLHRESAEALLRYFVKKCSVSDLDRDKADCVLGFLCRSPQRGPSRPLDKLPSDAEQIAGAVRAFRIEIDRILTGTESRELPAEHAQLSREYEFFFQELIDFRTFDQLMDCGILGRIHNLKKSFGTSFYHPDVLAIAGVFNGIFGKRFDDLFLQATRQIKSFAERVQQEGTSIMSRVDGEVRVKHLTEVEDEQILGKEYLRAREDFERVSNFKKAVDKRGGNPREVLRPPSLSETPPSAPADREEEVTGRPAQVTPAFTSPQAREEEYKFKQTRDQIRIFVQAADPKVCFTVPLPKMNVSLSQPEADAFRSAYEHEKSFRASFADALVNLVTAKVRVSTELLDFTQKKGSAYLWKTHADSLMYLMKLFDQLQDQTRELITAAQKRGLTEKVDVLNTALLKLHSELQLATSSLQSLDAVHQ